MCRIKCNSKLKYVYSTATGMVQVEEMVNSKYWWEWKQCIAGAKGNWYNHFGMVLVVSLNVKHLSIFWLNIYTPKYKLNGNIYNIYLL